MSLCCPEPTSLRVARPIAHGDELKGEKLSQGGGMQCRIIVSDENLICGVEQADLKTNTSQGSFQKSPTKSFCLQ